MLLFWTSALTLAASPSTGMVTVSSENEAYSINPYLSIFRDPSGMKTIDEVRELNFDRLETPLALGFTHDTVWLKFALQQTNTPADTEWLLQVLPGYTDYVELFLPQRDGSMKHFMAGDQVDTWQGSLSQRLPVFPIALSGAEPQTVYMKIRSQNSLRAELSLFTPAYWNQVDKSVIFWSALLMGLWLFAMIISLIHGLFLQTSTYFQYVLFVLFAGAIMSASHGWGLLLLPTGWHDILLTMAQAGVMLPLLYLSNYLLQLSTHFPRIYKVQQYVLWANFVLGLIGLVLGKINLTIPIHHFIILLFFLVFIVQAIWLIRRVPTAWLYLSLFGLVFAAAFLRIGSLQAWWSANYLTEYGLIIALGMQIVMMYLLVAYSQYKQRDRLVVENALAKNMQHELEQRQLFVKMLAHELRTPLSVIDLSTRNLKQMLNKQDGVEQRFNKITDATSRMRHLMSVCLSNEKLNTQMSQELRHPLSSEELLAALKDDILSLQGQQRIQFAPQPSSLILLADKAMLILAFSNIIDNALKYSGDQMVYVDFSYDQAWLSVTVRDQGVGFSLEVLDPKPFKRGRNIEQRNSGLGLGLTLARQIVEWHGGQIKINNLEKGSAVSIILPIAKNHEFTPK